MKLSILIGAASLLFAITVPAHAHDIWLEANTDVYKVGDQAHLDLKLGNHGNSHRDFKLASKLPYEECNMHVIAPDGHSYDLKPSLIDEGYTPKEGFWTATFTNDKAGLYTVVSHTDNVATYAPIRDVRCAVTYFLASKSLDRVPANAPGYDKDLGLALELRPESNPVAPVGPGDPISLRLYFKGKPLAGAVVSFISEGATLTTGFDKRYEVTSNINGRVSYTPKEAGRYLIVVHHETKESGKDATGNTYASTLYSSTIGMYVPAICPCCGE